MCSTLETSAQKELRLRVTFMAKAIESYVAVPTGKTVIELPTAALTRVAHDEAFYQKVAAEAHDALSPRIPGQEWRWFIIYRPAKEIFEASLRAA